MSKALNLLTTFTIIILSSALNKVFAYYGFSTLLYVVPLLLIFTGSIKYNLSPFINWIYFYLFIIILSMVLGLFGNVFSIEECINIIRILICIPLLSRLFSFKSEKITTIIVFSFLVNSFYLIVSKYFGFDINADINGANVEYISRYGGLGINPNVQAYLTVLLMNTIFWRIRKINYLILIIAIYSVYLTFSFTGMLALLVSIFVFLRNQRSFSELGKVALFITIGIVIFFSNKNNIQLGYTASEKVGYAVNFIRTGEGINELTTNRSSLNNSALISIKSMPYFGGGLGYGAHFIYGGGDIGVHNSFLEFIVDFGIILGVLCIVFVFVYIPKHLRYVIIIMAAAGHGFFYNLNLMLIILINVNNEVNKTRIEASKHFC